MGNIDRAQLRELRDYNELKEIINTLNHLDACIRYYRKGGKS